SIRSARGNVCIRSLYGDDDEATAGDYLKRRQRAREQRRVRAKVPQVRSDEDEDQYQRHHDVVVERSARIGPVKIAAQDLFEAAPGLRTRSVCGRRCHYGSLTIIS